MERILCVAFFGGTRPSQNRSGPPGGRRSTGETTGPLAAPAARESRVTDPPFSTENTTERDRRSFIETALRRSVIRMEAEPAADGEILTLSTSTGVGRAARRVVQAALRKEK